MHAEFFIKRGVYRFIGAQEGGQIVEERRGGTTRRKKGKRTGFDFPPGILVPYLLLLTQTQECLHAFPLAGGEEKQETREVRRYNNNTQKWTCEPPAAIHALPMVKGNPMGRGGEKTRGE